MPLKMPRKMDYNIKGSSKKAPMGKAFYRPLGYFINYGHFYLKPVNGFAFKSGAEKCF